jgi:hypothetical protein
VVQPALPFVCLFIFFFLQAEKHRWSILIPLFFRFLSNHTAIMFAAVPLKRSLSRSVIKIIQRTLPLVKSRGRSWTTNAKTRMPIDM